MLSKLGANGMSIQKRIKDITEKFNQFDDWEDRYRELIKFGKSLPEMSEELKVEDNKVKGCQSGLVISHF